MLLYWFIFVNMDVISVSPCEELSVCLLFPELLWVKLLKIQLHVNKSVHLTLWIWKRPLKWQVLNQPEQLQKDFVQVRALYHQNTKWEGTVWKNCVHFSIQTNLFSLFLENENEIRKIPSSVIYKVNMIPRKSPKKFCKCAWSDVC